jgi:hypothetical protein
LTDPNYYQTDEGEFVDHLLNGKGKRTDLNNCIEEGEFLKGKFIKGSKTLLNDGLAEGNFKNGKLHGQGKITWLKTQPKMVIKEGQFDHDRLIKGTAIDHCGNMSEGDFDAYIPEKILKGKITFANGQIEEGHFFHGKLDGNGKRTYPNGSIEEGIFQNGTLIQAV